MVQQTEQRERGEQDEEVKASQGTERGNHTGDDSSMREKSKTKNRIQKDAFRCLVARARKLICACARARARAHARRRRLIIGGRCHF